MDGVFSVFKLKAEYSLFWDKSRFMGNLDVVEEENPPRGGLYAELGSTAVQVTRYVTGVTFCNE